MRQEYEITLQPLPGVPVERALPCVSACGNKAGCAKA